MRLVQKIVTIIWVAASDAHQLKRSELGKENVNLILLPNKTGVLISTGKLDDGSTYSSFNSNRSLAKTIKGDYELQGRFTKMYHQGDSFNENRLQHNTDINRDVGVLRQMAWVALNCDEFHELC